MCCAASRDSCLHCTRLIYESTLTVNIVRIGRPKRLDFEGLVLDAVLSMLAGIGAGGLCGIAIATFASLIGHTVRYDARVGHLDLGLISVSFAVGMVLGAFISPIVYLTLCRKVGMGKALLPAIVGTLLGGFVGDLWDPLVAVLTGIAGFVVALSWTAYKDSASRRASRGAS
jgi:hypothetical protein